ncbi:hypothetical protein HK104_007381, partial [Borealophlyctis nickersoniae]
MSGINFALHTLITSRKELFLAYADLFNEVRNGGVSMNEVIEQLENFQRKLLELFEERAAGALPGGDAMMFITLDKKLHLAYADLFNEWRNGGVSTNEVIALFEYLHRKYQELEERVAAAVQGGDDTKPLWERVAAVLAAVMKEEVKLEEEEKKMEQDQLHQAAIQTAIMNNNDNNNNDDIVRDKVAAAAAELSIPFIDLTGMNKASCLNEVYHSVQTTIFYDPKRNFN